MRVAILGAGVAGLSAAHELVERGVDVDVYDRLPIAGGKARSVVVRRKNQEGFPGEHGFRYFASFYRHVIDTMERTPLPGGGWVIDNLCDAPEGMFAEEGIPPLGMPTIGPKSIDDIIERFKAIEKYVEAVSIDDIEAFAEKLWQVMTSCPARRFAEYENMSWNEFLGARHHSKAFNTWFVDAATHTLIAASGDRASSRTVGDITAQLMLGGWTPNVPSDRLLNGPTNDAWIDPWLAYLRSTKRFTLHTGCTIEEIQFETDTSFEVTGVSITRDGQPSTITADVFISALPVEVLAKLVPERVAALSPTLSTAAVLAMHVETMAGIQIYLRKDTKIVQGHTVYVGTPWGLTSVSQQQFWKLELSVLSDGAIDGVLSVDISNWTEPGTNGKRALDCTPDEICDEVLVQIRACLDDDPDIDLSPSNIHSHFIDPDIVFFENGAVERNDEPLLVNELGSWWIRPNAYTEVPNLYLAGDFVKTNTDLATMEGANEAARRAVNAIIRDHDLHAPLCEIWDVHEPEILAPLRWVDARRYVWGQPWSSSFTRPMRWLAHVITWLRKYWPRSRPHRHTADAS